LHELEPFFLNVGSLSNEELIGVHDVLRNSIKCVDEFTFLSFECIFLLSDEIRKIIQILFNISQRGSANLVELTSDLLDIVLELLYLFEDKFAVFTNIVDEKFST
jgi:hypothetical protein